MDHALNERLCPHCHGQGELERCTWDGDSESWDYVRCSWCRGRGMVFFLDPLPSGNTEVGSSGG